MMSLMLDVDIRDFSLQIYLEKKIPIYIFLGYTIFLGGMVKE